MRSLSRVRGRYPVREQRAKEGSAEQMCKRRGSSVITDRKIKRHDVRQDYDLGKLLGEGAFGKQRRARVAPRRHRGHGLSAFPASNLLLKS